MAQKIVLNHTAESINYKLGLIDENKNLLPYPYDYEEKLPDGLIDVGDGSILTKEQIGDTDIKILLNDFQLPAKTYSISLNITDILENTTTISGCELIVTVDNEEQVQVSASSVIGELNLSKESAILVYLKIPAGTEKGLLIKPQIEEYNQDKKMGIWVPNMNSLCTYADRRFNCTNTKLRVLIDRINALEDLLSGNLIIGSIGLAYTLDDSGSSYIVSGIGACTDNYVIIPSTYKGLPVTSIGDNAFWDCENLTSITIPDSVTSIGDGAFVNCTSLTSITIPSSVTRIWPRAFNMCTSLTSITVDVNNAVYDDLDGVLFIKDKTLLHTYPAGKTATSYDIPDSVTSIGAGAFEWCTSLTSITIPDSVTSIGNHAFLYCDSLISITIPYSVTSIGDSAFSGCDSLTSITIPDRVTSIGDNAFSYCRSLTSITIPATVMSIGNGAFSRCLNLTIYGYTVSTAETHATENNIPFVPLDTKIASGTCGVDGDNLAWVLTHGGTLAIYGNGNMANYSAADSVPWANYKYTNIKKVSISYGVTSIGDHALQDCDNITSIKIPDSVTSIGSYALYDCKNLKSITIPDGVTEIGTYAFSSTTGTYFTYIEVSSNNNNFCDVDGVLFSKDKTTLHTYPAGKADSSYAIPDGVTTIGEGAFRNCDNLNSITIPDGVTTIGKRAFVYCDNLKSIIIPYGVTKIGGSAFESCKNLTSITIPASVKSIGATAFHNCTSLTRVDITDVAAWCEISFSDAKANPLYYARNLYVNGTLATSITIPTGAESIGSNAFYYCSSLTSINIPDSVTSIGDYAFCYCTNLPSITIPDSVTSIGKQTFYNCTSLKTINCEFSKDKVKGSPWGARSADTINYDYKESSEE